MSTTGLEAFDKTLQTTHIWLDRITERLGPDRQFAWRVLGAVLHVLRDRLVPELSAHFAAQLPLLVRGLYYEGYEPARQPSGVDTGKQFAAEVAARLGDTRAVDPFLAVATVFDLLNSHVSAGQIDNIRQALPHGLAVLWPECV